MPRVSQIKAKYLIMFGHTVKKLVLLNPISQQEFFTTLTPLMHLKTPTRKIYWNHYQKRCVMQVYTCTVGTIIGASVTPWSSWSAAECPWASPHSGPVSIHSPLYIHTASVVAAAPSDVIIWRSYTFDTWCVQASFILIIYIFHA